MYIFLMPYLFVGLILVNVLLTFLLYNSTRAVQREHMQAIKELNRDINITSNMFNRDVQNCLEKINRCFDLVKEVKDDVDKLKASPPKRRTKCKTPLT